jgi:hypothetical protein
MKNVVAVLLIAFSASANSQVAKTSPSAPVSDIICGSREAKVDYPALCDPNYFAKKEAEAKAKKPSPDAFKAIQDDQRRRELDAEAAQGTDKAIFEGQREKIGDKISGPSEQIEMLHEKSFQGKLDPIEMNEFGKALEKFSEAQAVGEAAIRASTPNSTAGPSQDERPRSVFEKNELNEFYKTMDSYTQALVKVEEAKKARAQALRDYQAAHPQPPHQPSGEEIKRANSPSISSGSCGGYACTTR